MSLIKCSDCGTGVSDKAEKCPRCACPMSIKESEEKTQVIEQTSKRLKKRLLVGIALIVLGGVLMLLDFMITSIVFLVVWGILLIAGVLVVIQSRISIWWNHE